jgi:5-amino-6-(5-phospho-D-ribitylamino)uracil phosphatase
MSVQSKGKIIRLPAFRRAPGAVAIDLDGTLLNSQVQISERNRGAIEKCLARGIPVVIATSRAARTVRRFLGKRLFQDCSLVLQNGAIAKAAPPFSGYFKEAVPETLMREIIEVILQIESEVSITIELEGDEFGGNRPRSAEDLWKFNAATPDMFLTMEEALLRKPSKMAVGGLNRDLSHIIKAVSERFGDKLSVVPSDGITFLNITGIHANKPEALRKILKSKQVSLNDVIAFGDDFPDLEMLQACGTSIAMANAIPEVKAATPYCTAGNDDDGVAIALEKMLEDIS